jgi:hypothetical protein
MDDRLAYRYSRTIFQKSLIGTSSQIPSDIREMIQTQCCSSSRMSQEDHHPKHKSATSHASEMR